MAHHVLHLLLLGRAFAHHGKLYLARRVLAHGKPHLGAGHQRRTAGLAYQVVAQGMDGVEDFYLMDGGIITVNTETAAGLGADYSVFSTMGSVVEVTTTED